MTWPCRSRSAGPSPEEEAEAWLQDTGEIAPVAADLDALMEAKASAQEFFNAGRTSHLGDNVGEETSEIIFHPIWFVGSVNVWLTYTYNFFVANSGWISHPNVQFLPRQSSMIHHPRWCPKDDHSCNTNSCHDVGKGLYLEYLL